MRTPASSISASDRLLLNPTKQHELCIVQIQVCNRTNRDSVHNPAEGKASQLIVPITHFHANVTTKDSACEW